MREPNPFQQDGNWWNDRLGKLTGSRMSAAMNFLKSGKESTERKNLRYEIVAERITNTFADKYVTSDMAWGTEQEVFAKEAFEAMCNIKVEDVGFIDHPTIGFLGCSPDGFTSDGCLIEIKCPKTRTHMEYISGQVVPDDYKPQMILQAACTGRDVWFVSFDPRMSEDKRLFIRKFKPTPEEIKAIETAAETFLKECDQLFDFYNTKAVYFDKGE